MPSETVLHQPSKWVVWPRLAILAIAVVVGSSFTTFAVIRFIAQYQTERDLVRLDAEVEQLFLKYDTALQSLAARVQGLEFIVSADPNLHDAADPRPPTVPETWQRNRDAELRKRIESLQRRLLDLENRNEP